MNEPKDTRREGEVPPQDGADDAFGLLVLRYLDGLTEPEEEARLNIELAGHPGRREQFVVLARQCGQLNEILSPEMFVTAEQDLRSQTARLQAVEEQEESRQTSSPRDGGTGPQGEILAKTARHRPLKTNGKAAKVSSRRMHASRRTRADGAGLSRWPMYAAACALAGATLWLGLGRGGRLPHASTPTAQSDPKTLKHAADQRAAQEELARKEEAVRQAQEKSTRLEAERRKAQEQLAESERRRRELAVSPGVRKTDLPAEAKRSADADWEEKRAAELARLDTQRKSDTEKQARAEEEARQATEELARAVEARQEAEAKLAGAQLQDEEIGKVIFVAEEKRDSANAPAVLVRMEAGKISRTPLAKDMKLVKGDRIETSAPEKTEIRSPKSDAVRAVQAALELSAGATVDLAAGAAFEVQDGHSSRLAQGMLYADVSAGGNKLQAPASGAPVSTLLLFKTEFADVEAEQASFDLRVDAKEAAVQVAEGAAKFKNAHGEQAVRKLQKSFARKEYAPGTPAFIEATAIWRGRPPASSVQKILCSFNFEDGAKPAEVTDGTVEKGPERPGSRFCLAGVPDSQGAISKVYLGTYPAFFNYSGHETLSFDYWADALTSQVNFQILDRTLGQSIPGELSATTTGKWTRVTIRLNEMGKGENRFTAGDAIGGLYIHAVSHQAGRLLYIDNLEFSRPSSKGEPKPSGKEK